MKNYKGKEYLLFLILLSLKLAACNPCVNQTLNAIPYPNDCQAFILCWLSRAYLQTCPNNLFFDVKTNNCQPLVMTSCCNMTVPILVIPIHIYHGSYQHNLTNITDLWPFSYVTDKRTNHSSTTSLPPTTKPNTTLVTSVNQSEATKSIISTFKKFLFEVTDSSQTISGFTLNVTEQTIETTSIYINITDTTNSTESSQPNIYTSPEIISSTVYDNKNANSALVVSTNLTESTSPTTYTFFTELTDSVKTSSRSEITLNVTEIETTTPLATTSKYISTSPPKPSTIPSWSTGMPGSNQTHLTKYPDPITYTFFPAITDSSKSSSPSKITSMITKIESTTLSTTVKNIYETETTEFVKSSPPNVHTTPATVSSTESENKKPKTTLTMSTNQETSTVPSRSTGMPDSSQTHLTESPDPITYTFFPAMTDSSKSSPSEITTNVTEIKTTTSLATKSTYIHKTEATESIATSASNVYTPPVNVSSTEAESKKPRSTITTSTNPSVASTVPSWWTEMPDTSQTYPTESPDPITYTFFPKITDSSKSSASKITSNDIETSTPLATKIYITPASVSSTESSSKTSISTLTISTNPPEVSTVTSWWTGMPDSSQTSLSPTPTEPNQVETTTPIQTTSSENFITEITTEKSRNANDTNLSTTDSSHNTNLVTKTMSITNLSSLSTFKTTLISLNTDTETDETIAPTVEQYTKAKTTIKVGTTVSSKALTTTTDPFHTKSPTITESSTLQPIYSSTPSLPSTSNSSSSPIYFPTDPEWSSTTSQYSDNKSSTESVSGSTDLTTLPSEQTKLITEFIPTTASPSGIETVITSSTRSSPEIYSTTSADALQTETQILTESPTLQPLVSSTIKILSSTESPLHPTIMSTPRNERVSTITQYSVNETTPVTTVLPTSTPDFTETKAYTLTTITSSSPTGFLPSTVTTDPLPTRTQFTESSTLPSIFSSTTNLTYPSSSYPKVSSTTEVEKSSTETQKSENTSPTFASTQEHIREDNISTHVPSSGTELITTTEYEQTTTTTQSSSSQIILSTEYITHRPKTVESSSRIFTDTTENTRWPPITFTWPSPSSSLISTDYTTSKPITTVLSSPSEFNVSKNPEYTSTRLSTYPPKFTESSTIIDFFPTHYITNTEDDVRTDESIVTVLPSSPTDERRMDPITYTEYVTKNPVTTNKPTSSSLTTIHHSKYTSYGPIVTDETSTLIFTTPNYLTSVTDSSTTSHMKPSSSTTTVAEPEIIVPTTEKTELDPHIERSTIPDRTITSMNTTNFTTSSTSSLSTEKTTMKTVVTVPERTLPPLPYSPPPCVFATTTQKTTKSEKVSTIPSKSTSSSSTHTTVESSTDSSASRPECRFWDKFTFPDETDCKYYYECLFGDIRRSSCRYGYEFNPYALKCMPHLEANCQRPKSSNGIIDFLYYIMNLNNHNAKDQNEEEENGQDMDNELSD